jgi:hypothetical protein
MHFIKSILVGSGRLLAFICITALLIPYYLFIMCINVTMDASGEHKVADKWHGYGSKIMDFTAAKCGLGY